MILSIRLSNIGKTGAKWIIILILSLYALVCIFGILFFAALLYWDHM